MMLKINDQGRRIEGLPREIVLRDDSTPKDVVQALDAWREAREALQAPQEVLRSAEKEAQESTLLVKGERDRWHAEVREKTRDEADALRTAERACKRAADGFVQVLQDHVDDLRAVEARIAAHAHVEHLEAICDLRASLGLRGVLRGGLPAFDPRAGTQLNANGALDPAKVLTDRALNIDVEALCEIAGLDPAEDLGLVLVVGRGGRVWVVSRLAESMTRTGTWEYADENEEG